MHSEDSNHPEQKNPSLPDPWHESNSPDSLAEQTRTLLLLVGEGCAAVLGVASLVLGNRLGPLLQGNQLPTTARNVLLLMMVLGGLAPVIVLSVFAYRDRTRALGTARTIARIAQPIIPLAFYPALLCTDVWFRQPLNYLILLAGFVLLFQRCLTSALDALPEGWGNAWFSWLADDSQRQRQIAIWLVISASAAYAAYTGYLTILNHYRFGTGSYDLAIYDNMMFNALSGEPYRSSVLFGERGGNALSTHSEYGMVLFLPFYAIRPGAEAMLILQAVMFGFAAVPLYLFASTQIGRWKAVLLALAYLFYAPLHGGQFYDFHWLPLITFFYFWLFWALAKNRTWLAVTSILILFSLREDVAPGLAIVGLYLLLNGPRARLGLILTVVSCVWFVLNKFVIMPSLGSWWFDQLYKDLVAPGEKGWGSIIRTLVVNPLYVLTTTFTQAKLEYALHLLAPLAFLPLLRARHLWFLLPGFVFTLMTTGYSATTSIAYQYTAHWIAFLFAASILAIRFLEKQAGHRSLAAIATLCVGVISHSAVFGVVLVPSSFVGGIVPIQFSLTAEEQARYHEFKNLIAKIPPHASVTSTDFEAPHISNRKVIYAIGQDDSAGEYLLVRADRLPIAATREHVHKLLREKPYGLVANVEDRLYLFRQGQKSPETEAAVQALLRR